MIQDVIRDLHIYFNSINKPITLKARMGGAVNPSYLEVGYNEKCTVLTFWSVQGGGEAEKKLARAFRDDILEFINKTEAERCQEVSVSTPNTTTKPERKSRQVRSSTA